MCSMCDVGRITSKLYLVGSLPNLGSGLENLESGARYWAERVAETFARHLCTKRLVKSLIKMYLIFCSKCKKIINI
jgi:hypothetical protein